MRVAGLGDRERALVGLRLAPFDPRVEGAEQELDRALLHAGLVQQRGERRAAPLRGANRLREPRLAHRTRLEQRAAVAGALEGDRPVHARSRTKVIEGERERAVHRTANLQAERVRVDRRDVVVDQQVMQPGRRDRVPQRLER